MTRLIKANQLRTQPVSVTRQMAAAFPRLKAMAEKKGLELHHLGAGYPHPEVSDPSAYIAQKEAYLTHVAKSAASDDASAEKKRLMMTLYGYTDTLGPVSARQAFATVYGNDFGISIDPDRLIPTVGATGGISLLCSAYERCGKDIAYIVDAPTYTGFVSRASLYQRARFYSVDMDGEGPDSDALRDQIKKARSDGHFVAFYYTVPDGHNPGGISFSDARRQQVMNVIRDEGVYVVEDAPYTYISFEHANARPKPFVCIDPKHAVHLFTASKIGLPGPRVGFFYSEVELELEAGVHAPLNSLILTEASGDILFQNPDALRGFEAYLHDENMVLRESLWPIAESKNAIYGENRQLLLDGLSEHLGAFGDEFSWTRPGAGFFSVFTINNGAVKTDAEFVERLVGEYGVVTIPMFGFYPEDAKQRNPDVGLDQIRLSFSFNEHVGQARRAAMAKAVKAFANAIRIETGKSAIL